MGPLKIYHLHNAIFHPIQLCHFLSILLDHFPSYSLNLTKKLWSERKQDFLHIQLLQHIILNQRRQEITSLDTTDFLDTHVYIINLHWQSSGIIIFLCKCYIVTSDALLGSFLDVLFLLLTVILSEFHEKPRRNKG